MHYKNGREAKNGDKIVMVTPYAPPVAGILYDAVPGSDACNGRIAPTSQNDGYACLRDCLHVEDIDAADVPDTTAKSSSDEVPSDVGSGEVTVDSGRVVD